MKEIISSCQLLTFYQNKTQELQCQCLLEEKKSKCQDPLQNANMLKLIKSKKFSSVRLFDGAVCPGVSLAIHHKLPGALTFQVISCLCTLHAVAYAYVFLVIL